MAHRRARGQGSGRTRKQGEGAKRQQEGSLRAQAWGQGPRLHSKFCHPFCGLRLDTSSQTTSRLVSEGTGARGPPTHSFPLHTQDSGLEGSWEEKAVKRRLPSELFPPKEEQSTRQLWVHPEPSQEVHQLPLPADLSWHTWLQQEAMWPEENKAKAPEGPLLPVELRKSHSTSVDPSFCSVIWGKMGPASKINTTLG